MSVRVFVRQRFEWREGSVDAADAKCVADDVGSAASGERVDGGRVAGGGVVWRGGAGVEAELVCGVVDAVDEFGGSCGSTVLIGSVYELKCLFGVTVFGWLACCEGMSV